VVECISDIFQVLRFFHTGSGNADDFATGIDHTDGLLHRAHGVHGIGSGHGLDTKGLIATNNHITDRYFSSLKSRVTAQAITKWEVVFHV